MSKANNLTDFLTDIANAIRNATGQTGKINPQSFRSYFIDGKVEMYELDSGDTVRIDLGDYSELIVLPIYNTTSTFRLLDPGGSIVGQLTETTQGGAVIHWENSSLGSRTVGALIGSSISSSNVESIEVLTAQDTATATLGLLVVKLKYEY